MANSNSSFRVWSFRFVLALFVLGVLTAGTLAQTSSHIVRVEEDWELVVGTPDPDSDAPQVTVLTSPVGNIASLYAVFELNHQSLPEFTAGGLQLQVWDGEVALTDRRFPNANVLAQEGEVVRWTQTMGLQDGILQFEITNGTSTTWGSFGGQGYLKASLTTNLLNLDAYTPAVSVEHSGAGFAENRVQSLVLKRVRLHTSAGEVLEEELSSAVH